MFYIYIYIYILNNLCIHTHSGQGGACNAYSSPITSLGHGQLRQ